MVNYVKFGAQGWTSIVNRNSLASGQAPSKDSLNFFRYQVHQWREDLDPTVRFDAEVIESDPTFFGSTGDEIEIYLKTLLYLRSNQIQILVLRPMLIYPQITRNNPSLIMEAIVLARKSIRTIKSLSASAELYNTRQVLFNHFLSSALTVLFLVAAYDAETQVSSTSCTEPIFPLLGDTEELQTGLDLLERHHASSQSAAKLWAKFSRPRQQLIRLGFLPNRHRQQGKEQVPPEHHVSGGVAESENLTALGPSSAFGQDNFNFDQDHSLLWLDWVERAFMDSSVPFGLPTWM